MGENETDIVTVSLMFKVIGAEKILDWPHPSLSDISVKIHQATVNLLTASGSSLGSSIECY